MKIFIHTTDDKSLKYEVTQLDIYLSNLSIVLLYILNYGQRNKIITTVNNHDFGQIVALIIIGIVIIFSIYYSFVKSKKNIIIKSIMLIWITYLAIYSTIGSINYDSDNGYEVSKVFVLVALFDILYPLGIMREYFVKESDVIEISVAETNTSIQSVIYNTIVVIVIVVVSEIILKNYWADTFIYCITYSY